MVQPIDYRLNVQTPFEAAVSGYKVGLAGQEAQAQRQLLEAQRAKALADAEKLRNEQQRLTNHQAALEKIINNPNATAQDFIQLSANAPAAERESVQAAWKMLSDAEKQERLRVGGQVMSAFNAKRPDLATSVLEQQLAAFKGAGREKDATDTQALIDLIKENPQNGKLIFGPSMAHIPEFKDILEASLKVDEAKDPWVVVPGVGVFPRAQLEAAAKQAEAKGAPDVTITANIPDGAAADLKAGRVSKAAFDSVFGAGKADKILGVKK
jgi:hypothetical protein